jgi:hypothetical protein
MDQDSETPAATGGDNWESYRQATIRSFRVITDDHKQVIVFAHFHDDTNPGGHLNFTTIEPSGRQAIRRVFACGTWRGVEEVDDPQVDRIYRQQVRADAMDPENLAQFPQRKAS